MSEKKYTRTAVILHWLIAFAILGMFLLGWYMTGLPKEGPKAMSYDLFGWGIYTWQVAEPVSPRNFYFNFHKSLGITIFALILFRLFWRLAHKPPAFLESLKAWEKKFADSTHKVLYLMMLAVPLSGLIMSISGKYGVKWFGIPFLPGIENEGLRKAFESVHEIAGIILLIIIGLHIIGALKHKFYDKDETLKRMSLHRD
jgi:cytochrome b561